MIDVLDSHSLLKRLHRDSCAPVPFSPRAQNQLGLNQGAVHGVYPAKKTCPSCGTAVAETYCSTCGQKYEDDRFTLGSIFSALLKEIMDLESGALKTLVGLSMAPGRVVRDYWQRCTKPYLNPAKYFLFAVTVLQLVLWQTGVGTSFLHGVLDALLEGDEGIGVSQAYAIRFLGDYFALFFATGLPFLVITSYWGTERNPAEHVIFHLYASGHVALLWSLFVLLVALISSSMADFLAIIFAALVFSIAYYAWTYVTAHQPDTDHSVGREIAQALGTLVLFAVLYVLLLVVSVGVYLEVAGRGAS